MSGKNMMGVLFWNDRKQRDKQPDYTGSCMIDGAEYFISVWVRHSTTQADFKYLSLAFESREKGMERKRLRDAQKQRERQEEPARVATPAKEQEDLDDDIPF